MALTEEEIKAWQDTPCGVCGSTAKTDLGVCSPCVFRKLRERGSVLATVDTETLRQAVEPDTKTSIE